MAEPKPVSRKSKAFAALAGTVGLGMATTLVLDTRADEGTKPRAYRDMGGVWTICSGSTRGVKLGEVDTAEQCDARTSADLLIAVQGVERCAPGLKDAARHSQLRAAVRFNNNTGAFCHGWWKNRPSPAAFFRAGNWRGGCDELLLYVLVKGRRIQGLANRRAREHAICVEGLR